MVTPQSTSNADRKHATIGCITVSIIFILTFASCVLIIDCRDRQEQTRRDAIIDQEAKKLQQEFDAWAEHVESIRYTEEQIDIQNEYFATCFGNEARKGNMTRAQIATLAQRIQDQSDYLNWVLERFSIAVNCVDAGYPIDLKTVFLLE